MLNFDWATALPVAAAADPRAQRRRHLAAARHAGGHRDAPARRQRRRRRARDRDRADRRRAVQQRPRQRPLRDRLGRARARRPQRVGPRARGGDAGALRRPERDAAARLGSGHDSRRGLRLGRAVAALRHAAVRRPVRAGDPLRARRLRGVADRRRKMGAGGAGAAARPRVRRALPAARPRAAAGERSPARRWRAR